MCTAVHASIRRNSSSTAALSFGDLHQLLDLQRRIDQRLTPTPDEQGLLTPTDPFYLPDLVTATHLIKLSWPAGRELLPSDTLTTLVDRHASPIVSAIAARNSDPQASTLQGSRAAPPDSATCGALLLAANNLLGDRDPLTLAGQVGPIAFEAHQRSYQYTTNLLRKGGISSAFARAASARAANYRVRNRSSASQRDYRFSIEEIPPFLPRDWFAGHFTELRRLLSDASYRNDRLLRYGASFRLAELITGRKWSECAVALGVGNGTANYTQRVLGVRFAPDRLWPVFAHTVDQIADQLSTQVVRVNYTNRRQRLKNWDLPESDWRQLLHGLHRLNPQRGIANSHVAAVIIWSEVTQAEAPRCPIAQNLRAAGDTKNLTSRVNMLNEADLGRGNHFRLRRRLSLYAAQLATACDQNLPLHVSAADVVAHEMRLHTTASP